MHQDRYHRGLALLGVMLLLGACAHGSRDGASRLSQAGLEATTALGADVDDRVTRLRNQRAAQDLVAAYTLMLRCSRVTRGASTDPNCDVVALASARAKNAVNLQIGLLADVVAKRAQALRALGTAYAAFHDEAAYDEAGQVDAAIGPALAAVNAFGSAVGLAPVSALAGTGLKLAAHAVAADAQRGRLIRASRQILPVTRQMRLALEKERNLFGALDALLAQLDAETRRTMLVAGLLDARATVQAVAEGAGLPVDGAGLATALDTDQALRGAADVAMLDGLAAPSSGDLDAGIALLVDLEQQHLSFEKGQPLDAARVAADAERLTAALDASNP